MRRGIRSRAGQAVVFAGLAAMLSLVSGCEKQNSVIITYGPLLNAPTLCDFNCNGPKKPITEIALVACIYSIKNTGKDAVDFTFDANYLKPSGDYSQSYSGDNPKGLPPLTKIKLVKAGTVEKDLGTVVLGLNVSGQSEDEMGAKWATMLYSNKQVPDVPVLLVAYPADPTPEWHPGTLFRHVDVPLCQGPK